MQSVAEILKNKQIARDPHNKHEFQAYGNRLAEELNDPKHRSLYIKLAKNENRGLLEEARATALQTKSPQERGKIFMWKLTELKKELENKTNSEQR